MFHGGLIHMGKWEALTRHKRIDGLVGHKCSSKEIVGGDKVKVQCA